MCQICTSLKQPYNVGNIFSDNIHVYWLCVRNIYIWLSNKGFCNIHIRDTLNYLNLRCNTAKLLWVVIYVVCYGWFSPDLVVMNICRQRLIKVDRPLWQRSLANENAVVCRRGDALESAPPLILDGYVMNDIWTIVQNKNHVCNL